MRRDGRVELQVVDLQAGLARQLELHALDDHALEHLPPQFVLVGRGYAAAAQLAQRPRDPLGQVELGDHLVVDHREDAIDERRALGRRRAAAGLRRGKPGHAAQARLRTGVETV